MSDRIETLDLPAWVAGAQANQRPFREAVHIILTAIGTSTALRSKMIMKGGMLMAIRYESMRFTRDVDFSTHARYMKGDEEALLDELDRQITSANQQLPYDTMCHRQRTKMAPVPPEDNEFPGMKLNLGYAPRSNWRQMDRLLNGQSPNVVEIDHSYNEAVFDVEVLQLTDGDEIRAYSLTNLMAEKMRSLLQQPVRKRDREQDVYDLNLLIGTVQPLNDNERAQLVKLIADSCASRNIEVDANALRNPVVRAMAEKGYANLQPTIGGPLPPFNEAYQVVQDFFEGLPW